MLDFLTTLRSRQLDPASRLLLGQLLMFTGIAAVFPVAPLYVRSHGGGSLAIAAFIAGPMVANTIIQVPAGHLVDRVGRKPVLIGARLVFSVLSFGLFLNLGPLWLLALLRLGQGLTGGAYIPALRAALADLTTGERRAQRYAQLQAVEMVGLLIGPAIGGAVALWTDSAIFLCSGLGTLLGVTALFRLPETRGHRQEEAIPATPGWWRTSAVLVPSLALLAAGAMFAMYDVVWPQYLSARGIGPFLIGLSISAFAIPVLLLAGTVGKLGDRWNRRILLSGSFLVVASCAALYPEIRSYPVILLVGMIEATGFVVVQPVLFAVISETTSADVRGRAMGMGGFFQFGGSAVGAGVLGALFGVQQGLPFWCGASLCVAAAALTAVALPRRRWRASREPVPQLKTSDLEAQL